ncbi:Arabinose metabolism transcriptional repressor [Poriferisphaera corsica]|uniref:Arabinose metabolism transcriptional repressor n=1 Tax=Poriferisphaera corsica TaxID=2528020 RepID=A0A517YWF2_9BACT|nr:GntR family transcriptional regulator [Poriferisphaera corsica]QDU34555.1 Arabinose metabolism transcriptional repressor [Poriferisphaera corsica]
MATQSTKSKPVSNAAKHVQISDYLRKLIRSKKLPPRHMLESEAELCERFNVSRGPVRQALAALEQDGLIYRISGRGSFVAPRNKSAATPNTTSPIPTPQTETPTIWLLPVGGEDIHNLIFAGLLSGLEKGAAQHNASILVSSLDNNQHTINQHNQNIKGIFTSYASTEILSADFAKDLPKVWLMSRRIECPHHIDAVSPDNNTIGQIAANYLIEQGHKHLAFFSTMSGDPSCNQRLPGFLTAAGSAGVKTTVIDDTLLPDHPPISSFSEVDQTLINKLVDIYLKLTPRPTGMFIIGDHHTALAQPVLQKKGLKIGKDLQIISCNNNKNILNMINPRPVTIDMNLEDMGVAAAHIMAYRTANPNSSLPPMNITPNPTLILP